MELKKEDVVAIVTEKEGLLCKDCATDKDWDAVSDSSKLFMEGGLKDKDSLFFCDKCKTRLLAK